MSKFYQNLPRLDIRDKEQFLLQSGALSDARDKNQGIPYINSLTELFIWVDDF